MPAYADIVFSKAVRQTFTYALYDEKVRVEADVGKRVWVPFQKHKAIGFIVRIHNRTPDFSTRPVEQVLDKDPILSEELLALTGWIHRFYYCGWGEAIQAALPAGLNFYAEKKLRAAAGTLPEHIGDDKADIMAEVKKEGSYQLKEANKRWGDSVVEHLIGQKLLEVWEEPIVKMDPRTENVWRWTDGESPAEAEKLAAEYKKAGKNYKWVRALKRLTELDLPEFQRDLISHELLEYYTLNRIAEEGLICVEEVESHNLGLKHEHDPDQIKTLNEEQHEAFEQINAALELEKFASFLLYGVTGSGKTEIYIHALREALARGKGGLILVPEIGLTPQIVKRFYMIFGDNIAVLHSRLTDRERYDAWRALRQNEKRIAIGVRSAVFAPVQNLGLIIVDEEHDASYKQKDPAPRYHGRDTAIMRAHINDAVVVMGSATPSMVALQGARQGKSTMLTLESRPFEAVLPEVEVLDLKQYRSAMRGPFAVPLFLAIEEAVERGEQAILLYNRRGYSFYLRCEHCGDIPECPNCAVSLTFHKMKKQLRCHYCGYSERQPRHCRECGHEAVRPRGSGTQQLEEQIATLFPEARILRMDFDTTSGKHAHARILKAFERREADILVGTQMVGKGLDFPDVTVVGVIDADTELAFPSFRSGERMFQLLSQVAGRSGRAGKEGKVFFQTWQPDHPAIRTAQKHQFKAFARQELVQRNMLQYPPYSRLIRFVFKGKQEGRVRRTAMVFTDCLAEVIGQHEPVLGPSPAPVSRVQNYYLWESLVKIKPTNGAGAIEHLVDQTFDRYNKRNNKPRGASRVRINVNVDALE